MVPHHGHETGVGFLGNQLDIEERGILIGMLKVQFVKSADTGEEHTVFKLAHVLPRLQNDGGIARLLMVVIRNGQRLTRDGALG